MTEGRNQQIAAISIADAGVVGGMPKLLLRLEGAAALAVATTAYAQLAGSWPLFALLFLVPDLSMLGYLAGPRIGAAIYNFGHSYLAPLALGAVGMTLASGTLPLIALIWIAHIGFDRGVGYGLKYPTGFGHTHLGLPFARAVTPAQ